MWYKRSQNEIEIMPPIDGSGHMTGNDPALIFEAKYDGKQAGYALVVMPKGDKYCYVGQVTVRPEYRMNGVATALYNNIDIYLSSHNLPRLRPSRDLTPGSRRIWDKRQKEGK